MSNYFFFGQRNWIPSTQKTHDEPKVLFNIKESIRIIKKHTKLLEKSLSFSTNASTITFRLLYFYTELNTSFCLIHTRTHTHTFFFYPLNLVPYTSIMLFSFGLTNINEKKVASLTIDPLRTVCNHVFSSRCSRTAWYPVVLNTRCDTPDPPYGRQQIPNDALDFLDFCGSDHIRIPLKTRVHLFLLTYLFFTGSSSWRCLLHEAKGTIVLCDAEKRRIEWKKGGKQRKCIEWRDKGYYTHIGDLL